jgi:hypothetical protein
MFALVVFMILFDMANDLCCGNFSQANMQIGVQFALINFSRQQFKGLNIFFECHWLLLHNTVYNLSCPLFPPLFPCRYPPFFLVKSIYRLFT